MEYKWFLFECYRMLNLYDYIYCNIIVYVYIFFVILVVYSGSGYDGFFGR